MNKSGYALSLLLFRLFQQSTCFKNSKILKFFLDFGAAIFLIMSVVKILTPKKITEKVEISILSHWHFFTCFKKIRHLRLDLTDKKRLDKIEISAKMHLVAHSYTA